MLTNDKLTPQSRLCISLSAKRTINKKLILNRSRTDMNLQQLSNRESKWTYKLTIALVGGLAIAIALPSFSLGTMFIKADRRAAQLTRKTDTVKEGISLSSASNGNSTANAPINNAKQQQVGTAAPIPYGDEIVGKPSQSQQIKLAIALRPAHQHALTAFVKDVSTPGSPLYHHFLKPGQFEQRFGPTSSTIKNVKQSLAALGFKPGNVLDDLDVFFTTTVGHADKILRTNLATVKLTSGRLAMANLTAPELPHSLAIKTQAVLGITTIPQAASTQITPPNTAAIKYAIEHRLSTAGSSPTYHAIHPTDRYANSPRTATAPNPQETQTTGPQPCAAASANASPGGSYTANQLASAYGYTSAYSKGDFGQNITFGVVSESVYSTSDVSEFQSCYGTNAVVNVIPVAGGTTSTGAIFEANSDIETIISFDPEATIDVYEVGPTNNFFDQTYATIAQADTAQIISTSYSGCELTEPASYAAATATVLAQMAAQGETVVVGSGDNGAQDCLPPNGTGGTVDAVSCPATNTCLAVGTNGAQGAIAEIGNTTSSAPEVAKDTVTLSGVACMTTSSCLAVANDNSTHVQGILPITGGSPGTLEAVANTFSFAGIGCSDESTCYALGENQNLQGMIVPTTNGIPGSAELVGQPTGSFSSGTDILSIACASSSSCTMVGNQDSTGIVVPLTGGVPGTPVSVSGTTSLVSISCETANLCLAVGSSSNGPVAIAITDGSPGTPTQLNAFQSVDTVGCYSSTQCLVGGSIAGGTGAIVSQSEGAVVNITSGTQIGEVMRLAGSNNIEALGCTAGTTTCLAGGASSGAFFGISEQINSGTPAGPYSVSTASSTPISLQGITCTTTSNCEAVGEYGGTGVVVPVTNGAQGTAQTISGTTELYGIACESSSTCIAVGTDNNQGVIVPVVNGTPETPEMAPASTSITVSSLTALTCTSSTTCIAVGTGNGLGVVEQVSGTMPGSASYVQSSESLLGISCDTTTQCIAVGSGYNNGVGVGVVVPISSGSPGSAESIGSNATLAGIACATSSSCIAVGGEIQNFSLIGIVLPIDNGSAGTLETVPQITGLNSVLDSISCEEVSSNATCIAVGGDGSGSAAEVNISSGIPSSIGLVNGPNNLTALACPTASSCEAVAGNLPPELAATTSPSANNVVTLINGFDPPLSATIPTALSPGYPATQPGVTAVGGTTLEQAGPPPMQSVWAGSGGGVSSLFTMPAWQSESAVPGVVTSLSSGTPCSALSGSYCREVPDVSMDANADQGYLVYSQGAWQGFGGTSSSTPAFSAMLGLVEDACGTSSSPERLGMVNPSLYALSAVNSAAFDQPSPGINTDVSGTSGSLYSAPASGQRYSMATGLGSPVGGELISGLCGTTTNSSITASAVNSSGAATVTATIADSAGPIPGVKVSLTQALASGSGTASSTISPTTATTNSSGIAYFSVSDSTAQEITYHAIDVSAGNLETTASANVDFTTTSSQPPPSASGGAYTSISPVRLVDTRCSENPRPSYIVGSYCNSIPAANASVTAVTSGSPIDIQVAGIGGVPSSGTTAVVLNITATGENGGGFLTAFPTGSAPPSTSNLNFQASENVANMTTVGLGSNGEVSIAVGPSNRFSQVIVDLEGYYSAPSEGVGLYDTLQPARIVDTRCSASSKPDFCNSENLPTANVGLSTLSPGTIEQVQAVGVGGVPTTGVSAVALVVSATNYSADGYLTLYPASTNAPPTVSNLNFATGQGAVSNLVVVKPGHGGFIDVTSNVRTDFVVDVEGYFTSSGGSGSLFYAQSKPTRICDTRSVTQVGGTSDVISGVTGQCANSGSALAPGASISVQVAGLGGSSSNALAGSLNVTATGDTGSGYLTVYPGGTRPVVAGVNWGAGETAANLVIAELSSSGTVTIYNGSSEPVNVVVDLEGYFAT